MKILIVDDVPLNREMLEDMLSEEAYQTLEACDGVEALQVLEEHRGEIQTVLLDLIMPRMDGFTLLRELKRRGDFSDIPVIVISAASRRSAEAQSLELGATDFIQKPFSKGIVIQRVRNASQLFLYRKSLEKLVSEQTHVLQQQAAQIKKNTEKIIDILGTVVEYRNLESGEHIARVKGFTRILALSVMELFPRCGMTPEKAELIASASPLHDIGKITIPDHILLKPGPLTPAEFELMKTHTTRGAEMLERIEGAWDSNYARTCYEICLYHHERYNGRGYPKGLKGDEIPLPAQLVSLADVYDALLSKRVYKEPYSLRKTYDMIVAGQCGVFSPKLLQCFAHARDQLEELASARSSSHIH
ncbi:MAG: response regulator [Eubacteriales bacterium]|nr:response regulator [Eubacteriales bacterium]